LRASAIYDLNPIELIPPRKRLLEAHQENHSWHKVAKALKLNVRYVYNFAIYGRIPRNKFVLRKLLGRKTINEHLASDRISDMPIDLLKWAFENRKEMVP
jgi:hypothetical protein